MGGQGESVRRDVLPWHHHPCHPAVVVPVRIDPAGVRGPTANQARWGRWRRAAPGWFVPAEVDASGTDQRIVEAAVHLSAYGAVTGWAALHWMGARWFGHHDRPVVLATGDAGIRRTAGIEVSEERLLPDHIEVVDGLRVTTAVRSVLFEMRHAPTAAAALVALDMACYDDLVSLAEVATEAATLGTWTGIPQARAALAIGDENAWSPAEVAARLVWDAAGLARPLTNVPIFDRAGRHLVTPDLLDPVLGIVGEYDGAVHRDRDAHAHDVQRDELYRGLGVQQVVMTAVDLSAPDPAIARLVAARARATGAPASARAWTTEPPGWWWPTRTVAQRRALPPTVRERALRYRRAA